MRWAGHVARKGEKSNAYRLLVGNPEGKRPQEDQDVGGWIILELGLGEVGWGDVDWIGLAKDSNRWRALVNTVTNLRGSMKCWETIEWPVE
jgi:hypothetical protein